MAKAKQKSFRFRQSFFEKIAKDVSISIAWNPGWRYTSNQ